MLSTTGMDNVLFLDSTKSSHPFSPISNSSHRRSLVRRSLSKGPALTVAAEAEAWVVVNHASDRLFWKRVNPESYISVEGTCFFTYLVLITSRKRATFPLPHHTIPARIDPRPSIQPSIRESRYFSHLLKLDQGYTYSPVYETFPEALLCATHMYTEDRANKAVFE